MVVNIIGYIYSLFFIFMFLYLIWLIIGEWLAKLVAWLKALRLKRKTK